MIYILTDIYILSSLNAVLFYLSPHSVPCQLRLPDDVCPKTNSGVSLYVLWSWRKQPLKYFKLHRHWAHMNILGVSPSVAAVPQDDRGVFGNISSPPSFSAILRALMVSLKCSLQARVAHSRHKVFPVPVGLSRTPFTFWKQTWELQTIWCVFPLLLSLTWSATSCS